MSLGENYPNRSFRHKVQILKTIVGFYNFDMMDTISMVGKVWTGLMICYVYDLKYRFEHTFGGAIVLNGASAAGGGGGV